MVPIAGGGVVGPWSAVASAGLADAADVLDDLVGAGDLSVGA